MFEKLKKFLGDNLPEGINLNESFIQELSQIFEAAVDSKVASIITEKEEEYQAELLSEATETKEQLIDTMDVYLDQAVETYAINFGDVMVNATKANIYENLINNIKNSFLNEGLKLEEGSTEIVSELNNRIDNLETSLNEQINENFDLKNALLAEKVSNIFDKETANLSEMDKETLKDLLAESEFDNEETAKEKIKIMKEHFLTESTDKKKDTINESIKPTSSNRNLGRFLI